MALILQRVRITSFEEDNGLMVESKGYTTLDNLPINKITASLSAWLKNLDYWC